jgi:dihydrofolate reductase
MAEAGNNRLLWPDREIEAPNRRTMHIAPRAIAAATFNSMRAAGLPVYEAQENYVIGQPEEAPAIRNYFDHRLVSTIPEAIELIRKKGLYRFFLIGDAQFYKEAIHHADHLHLTTVEGDYPTMEFFPDFTDDFEADRTIPSFSGSSNGVNFTNQSYVRKKYK